MKQYHFIVTATGSQFKLLALEPLQLNKRHLTSESGFVLVSQFDDLLIPCHECKNPHLYKFVKVQSDQEIE